MQSKEKQEQSAAPRTIHHGATHLHVVAARRPDKCRRAQLVNIIHRGGTRRQELFRLGEVAHLREFEEIRIDGSRFLLLLVVVLLMVLGHERNGANRTSKPKVASLGSTAVLEQFFVERSGPPLFRSGLAVS